MNEQQLVDRLTKAADALPGPDVTPLARIRARALARRRRRQALTVAAVLPVVVLGGVVASELLPAGPQGPIIEPVGEGDAALDLEALVRRLPETTASVLVIDAAAAAEALGADPAALGRRAELPAPYGPDGPDPDGQLGATLTAAITPLLSPSEGAHEVIDLGQVTGIVSASIAEPRGGLTVVATDQPTQDLVAAYTEAGLEAAGDDVYVATGTAEDLAGGFPAIQVSDGLLILATSTELIDLWQAAAGPTDDALTLLAAADQHWAITIQLPRTGAASCGTAIAIVSDGVTDELLILDGGQDHLDRGVADQLGFQIGEGQPEAELTRYPLTSSDPTPAALVTGKVLTDSPPLTTC